MEVVTTLPTYASIAHELAGNLANVESIARGDVDPHFVAARPSFAAMIQKADLFVTTGLDLELWVPVLIERANNSKVVEGAPGHVVAYAGVVLREVPESVSRTGGDVHMFGSPHIHTDPANAVVIARNIAEGLKRVDPRNAEIYDHNLDDFSHRIADRLFGEQLVGLLDANTLLDLAIRGEFWSFVDGQTLRGQPLVSYLGGWLGDGASFRDKQIVCYHKNWAYFTARFRLECAMYVEPLPGIPPSPGHVRNVIEFIRDNDIPAILAANFYSRSQVQRVAEVARPGNSR